MTQPAPHLSIVVPVYNEEESVAPLVDAVRAAMPPAERWELVLVDDGSADDTAAVAARLADADPRVRLIRLARNCGQTQAMQAGFDHARGAVIVSMDGDLQNDPLDIPRLVATLDEGYDMVTGYRVRRQDRVITRKLPSWVANRLIATITGVHIRDNGCSLKAYRRELLEQLHLYSDMHRFLPALAAATSGARITEIPVRHHARQFGTSKYGLSRIAKLLADLLTITMISYFRERPLAMFGTGALVSLLLAFVFAGRAVVLWVQLTSRDLPTSPTAYVLPGCAVLWMALSMYLLMLGLIAEEALQKAREEDEVDGTWPAGAKA